MMENELSYDPDKNYDEDILAQQREIEKEIVMSQALIGEAQTLDEFIEEYAEDAVYRHKVKDLKTRYKSIRRVRGDGNCFFRAFGFAYLEKLLSDQEEYKRFLKTAQNSKDELLALGFPPFTLEDFHDMFLETLQQVENPGTVTKLLETFNNQGLSDYFVVYLRLLVSGHLQKNEELYLHFVDGERTIKDFCAQEVEPMGKESDHIHTVALIRAIHVPVGVEYMDRDGEKCNIHIFTSDENDKVPAPKPAVYLLYRPGHYDILYPL